MSGFETMKMSVARARKLTAGVGTSRVFVTPVEDGHVDETITFDARSLGADGKRPYRVIIIVRKLSGDVVEVESGAVAFAGEVAVASDGSATAHVSFDIAEDVSAVELVVCKRPTHLKAILCGVGCAVAIAAIGIAIVMNWGDPRAKPGYYEGKTKEEIQRDLDEEVAWYSMEISIASYMEIEEGQTEVEARIENVENNHCDQKVKLFDASNPSDILFESGAIAPGEYIQNIELAHPLKAGTYTLTAQFQGYERNVTLMSDEGQFLGHDRFGGSCAAEVTLRVVPKGMLEQLRTQREQWNEDRQAANGSNSVGSDDASGTPAS